MSRGQRAKIAVCDDWMGIIEKGEVGIAPITTDRTTIVKDEINELKKEIEQIKAKQQKPRKITIKVR